MISDERVINPPFPEWQEEGVIAYLLRMRQVSCSFFHLPDDPERIFPNRRCPGLQKLAHKAIRLEHRHAPEHTLALRVTHFVWKERGSPKEKGAKANIEKQVRLGQRARVRGSIPNHRVRSEITGQVARTVGFSSPGKAEEGSAAQD